MKEMIKIKTVDGFVLHTSEADTIREAVQEAVDMRKSLRSANLFGANLSILNLSLANLRFADLRCASLNFANLCGANLSGANLSGATLRGANLNNAKLRDANLDSANLSNANLHSTDLHFANLRFANLHCANLHRANLRGANLVGAHLYNANLDEVQGAELAFAQTRIIPDGDIIGWKKCSEGELVKLLIPAEAKRINGTGRKCRASKAKVLEIFDRDGNPIDCATSRHDNSFVYRVGEIVCPTRPFDENPLIECSSGIHFYITRAEAEAE